MPQPGTQGEIYRFGAFELASGTGELRKHGLRLKLQDQPLRILILLVENSGEVVTREQIQKRLWADDTHVDYENAINSAVRKLRDALSDTSANPRFIETLARRGYRFIGQVSRTSQAVGITSPPPENAAPAAEAVQAKSRALPRKTWILAAAALILLGLCAVVSFEWFRRVHPSGLDGALSTRPSPPVPLTSYPGIECCPSFSPDGSRVAFAWDGPRQDNFDIYVKQIGPGEPQRLTHDSAQDSFPAWSPDGKWIAFLRVAGEESASVMVLPSLGGPEREIARIRIAQARFDYFSSGPPLAWSADGNYLFTMDRPGNSADYGIVRVAVDSGEKRTLTNPADLQGDTTLSVSPDGRTLAFARIVNAGAASDLFTVPLSEWTDLPKPRRITFDGKWIFGLAWTENGRELVFLSNRDGNMGLWKQRVIGSEQPVRVEVMAGWNNDAFGSPQYFAVSRDGRRMVYNQIAVGRAKIWHIEIDHGRVGEPALLIASTQGQMSPQFSPDGKKIALRSNQSGRGEVWVYNFDGTSPVQITSSNSGLSGSPAWSPDGRRIAFDSSNSGQWEVYTVNSQGGKPTPLTRGGSGFAPSWSRDGKWVYFGSARTGRTEIWKIPADGGSEVQVTKKGGFVARESIDGKSLFYTKTDIGSALWQMPMGGQERMKTESIESRNFAVGTGGIYFVQKINGTRNLRFLQFASGHIRTLASLGRLVSMGLAVSPDERSILFNRPDLTGSDLMLVENFVNSLGP